jgi:hypothetical protein
MWSARQDCHLLMSDLNLRDRLGSKILRLSKLSFAVAIWTGCIVLVVKALKEF